MSKILQYQEHCSICGTTIETWAWKTTQIQLYWNDGQYQEKPICSHRCNQLYNLNPLAYDID